MVSRPKKRVTHTLDNGTRTTQRIMDNEKDTQNNVEISMGNIVCK